MQRIFEYGDIQNITFTPDEERTPSYLIIYRRHTLITFNWQLARISEHSAHIVPLTFQNTPFVDVAYYRQRSYIGVAIYRIFATGSLHCVL